jgi:hypothetical protein
MSLPSKKNKDGVRAGWVSVSSRAHIGYAKKVAAKPCLKKRQLMFFQQIVRHEAQQ